LVAGLPTPNKKYDDIACGTQAPGYEPIGTDGLGKIIGGQHAKPHSWPWAAALMPKDELVWCGATLIDKRWLISAGHCFNAGEIKPPGDLRVKLGADDHGQTPDQTEPSQQVVGIEKFWVHPNYTLAPDLSYAAWDITLVKLDQDVPFNAFVRPICLPQATDRLQGDDRVVTVGWGQTEAGSEPALLQQVVLPVVDRQTCTDDYRVLNVPIDDSMLCAGNQTFGGIGSCNGDSGSGLMARRGDAWVHYGIASFVGGHPCDQPKQPTVYGYVPVFVDWVKGIMQSES